MSFKDELLKSKRIMKGEIQSNIGKKTIDLDDKVDQFIKWYKDNMIKGYYTEMDQQHLLIKMRNFIEKMAVWYELRYPDYEVDRFIFGSRQEDAKVSKVMFQDNPYIHDLLGSDSEVGVLDWDEFYNVQAFIDSLPRDEKFLLLKPQYQDIVYWDCDSSSAHLHLSQDGTVEMAEYMDYVIPGISSEDLEGKNIKEVIKLIQDKKIKIPKDSEFVKAVNGYDKWTYQNEEIFNCVMYRIIARGGNRLGPHRAFLFAKEFKRNIDIPMMYGVDRADPDLRLFVNEYIKAGGSKELVCYNGYFSRKSKKEKLETISIQELILTQGSNPETFYTQEETELHQRFVDVIARKANQDEVKRLRLDKKMRKNC